MATGYTIRDRNGRQLDRIQANSAEEAAKLFKAKRSNVLAKTAKQEPSFLHDIYDAATHEYLPKKDIKTGLGEIVDKPLNFAYEYGVRPMSSPLGIATSFIPVARAKPIASAVVRGLKMPVKSAEHLAEEALIKAGKGPKQGFMEKLGRVIEETKRSALTAGFPGTNLSFHGTSLAATAAMATPLKEGGILKGAYRAGRMLLDQPYAEREAKKLAEKVVNFKGQVLSRNVRDKVTGKFKKEAYTLKTLGEEAGLLTDYGSQAEVKKLRPLLTAGKYNPARPAMNVMEELFDKPLFGTMVPAHKWEQFERVMNHLVETTKPKNVTEFKALAKTAAETGNTFFGGGDTPGSMARYLFLAPAWYSRHMKMGKGIVKAFANPKDPRGAAYRTFTGNMATTLGLMDVANKTLSGHHMWQNNPGKNFQIDTGREDDHGRRAYIDLMAGGIDFTKLPVEVVHQLMTTGNALSVLEPIKNRLNTVNRTVLDMIGANYKPAINRYPFPIRKRVPGGGTTLEYGPKLPQQLIRAGEDIIDNMGPGWLQAGEDLWHKGERDPLVSKPQAIAKAFEIPLKFARDPRPLTESRQDAAIRARELAKRRRENLIKKRKEALEAKRRGGS